MTKQNVTTQRTIANEDELEKARKAAELKQREADKKEHVTVQDEMNPEPDNLEKAKEIMATPTNPDLPPVPPPERISSVYPGAQSTRLPDETND